MRHPRAVRNAITPGGLRSRLGRRLRDRTEQQQRNHGLSWRHDVCGRPSRASIWRGLEPSRHNMQVGDEWADLREIAKATASMCPGRRSTLFSALVANAETARLNERRAILRPPSCPVDGSSRLFRPRVGQEAAEQADRRQECAEVVDQRQARPVSQYPEKRRPDAAEAEADRPKNRPATAPTLPGVSSCA